MVFNIQPAQSISMFINIITHTNLMIVTGPNGLAKTNIYAPLSPSTYYYLSPFGAFFPGTYTLQFVPQGTNSETITFSFHNRNSHNLVTITNGVSISTSLTTNYLDYAKFQVSLNAGQTLNLGPTGGSATVLEIYNYLGTPLGSGISEQLLFTAPTTGVYYVIYYATDYSAHSYSTTPTITP
jgi:hypothetical protein